MPSRAFPLVAWGLADTIAGSGWSDTGTPAAASGETDPFGGTEGVILTDNDGGAAEGRIRTTSYAVSETTFIWTPCIRAGTATASLLQVRDFDAADYPLQLSAAWSGGVPTITPSSTGGNPTPTVWGTIPIGGGWYAILCSCPWTAGNRVREELYGASGTAAATGTTRYYLRNLVLLDLLGSPKAFSRPAQGYEAVTAPSGTRDAWKVKAPDEVLQGRVSWVPTTPRSFPQIVSGWDGQNQAVAVNAGVKAMLEAGWDMNLLRVATDRSACTSYNDAYLTQPGMDWSPELEGNADRALNLELVSSTPFVGF